MKNLTQKFFYCIILLYCFVISSCQIKDTEKHAAIVPVEIAVLMPMTGEDSVAGQEYNKLIKLGLEDALKTHVHVTSYDASDAKQAAAAMEKIVKRNTKIILGPLYSPITSLISAQAKNHDIIILTMSNNPALADEKLFVFGHAPLKQLDNIINYFLQNHYKNFITLLPDNQYSKTVNKIIQSKMIPKSTLLSKTALYASTPEAIDKAVASVSSDVDTLNEIEDNILKPVVYLADDAQNLHLLFNSLRKYNLDKKAIIVGDNRIDIDYPEPITIYFTGSLNIINSDVMERAKNLGIYHMSFMHLVAYDLGRLTATYIGEEFSQSKFLGRLNSNLPYIGISGNINFTDSIAQRKYDLIKKENGEYSTVHSE